MLRDVGQRVVALVVLLRRRRQRTVTATATAEADLSSGWLAQQVELLSAVGGHLRVLIGLAEAGRTTGVDATGLVYLDQRLALGALDVRGNLRRELQPARPRRLRKSLGRCRRDHNLALILRR